MPKTTLKLTTWSLSKTKAKAKLNEDAYNIFTKVTRGLNKQGFTFGDATLTLKKFWGFLFYKGTYEIVVVAKPKITTKVTVTRLPSKKLIKKTPKKVYKKQARDTKGRFKKKGK